MLSERLKQARESIGKTQKEMAKLASASYRVWQDYESGSVIPGGKVFESLSKLGFNVNWLLTGQGEMKIGAIPDETTKHDYRPGEKDIFFLSMNTVDCYAEINDITDKQRSLLMFALLKVLLAQPDEWINEEQALLVLESLIKLSKAYKLFRNINKEDYTIKAIHQFLEESDFGDNDCENVIIQEMKKNGALSA